jgi:hypothetical protein
VAQRIQFGPQRRIGRQLRFQARPLPGAQFTIQIRRK